jgi:hypothetical protein
MPGTHAGADATSASSSQARAAPHPTSMVASSTAGLYAIVRVVPEAS